MLKVHNAQKVGRSRGTDKKTSHCKSRGEKKSLKESHSSEKQGGNV